MTLWCPFSESLPFLVFDQKAEDLVTPLCCTLSVTVCTSRNNRQYDWKKKSNRGSLRLLGITALPERKIFLPSSFQQLQAPIATYCSCSSRSHCEFFWKLEKKRTEKREKKEGFLPTIWIFGDLYSTPQTE